MSTPTLLPSHDTTESRKYQLASRPAIKSWTCPIISAANGLTDTGSPHLKFKGWLDSSSFCHMLYICCTGYRYHSSLWLYMTINHYNLDAHMVTKPSIHSGSKAAKHEHSRYLDATSSMPRILLIPDPDVDLVSEQVNLSPPLHILRLLLQAPFRQAPLAWPGRRTSVRTVMTKMVELAGHRCWPVASTCLVIYDAS